MLIGDSLMAKYVEGGVAVDGLQALYKAPMFRELPDGIRVAMAPDIELGTKQGWEYLKKLPLPRENEKANVKVASVGVEPVCGKGQEARPYSGSFGFFVYTGAGRGGCHQRGHANECRIGTCVVKPTKPLCGVRCCLR